MLHTDSARDAIRADDTGTFSRPETKVDRSRRGEPLPKVNTPEEEPATAEEER